MNRESVKSSMLKSVGYDESQGILQVEFNNGKVFDYFNVPPVVFREMMESDSAGKYFHKNVKSSFESREA